MIISGNTFRSVLRENRFSTDLGLSFDTCTGVCDIGFSGQSKVYKVSFASGKIFDHESRYCGSYLPDTQVNINTNFSGTAYNYSINSDEIVRSGTKDDFYAERFFVNLSGCVLDASIEIRSDKPSLSLSTDQTFITGSYITGTLSSNSPSGVKIFSGYFDSESPFSFYSIPTGLVKASSSQQILIQQNYPSLGGLISNYTLNTSAGDYDNELTITGVDVPFLNYIFEVEEGANTLDSITQATFTSGVSKVGSLILNYGYETNREELVPTGLPINISLTYYSGVTGYMGMVSDVVIASGGNGYLAAPTVIFSGGGASIAASGQAILGVDSLTYDSVVDVNMTYFGSGYNSTPTVIFSGGTGILNNFNPNIASGIAETSFYTKSVTGFFDLRTGINDNLVSYRDNSFTSGSAGYVKNNVFITDTSSITVQVVYDTKFDNEILVAKLTLSGIDNNIIEKYITGVK
jgi:hypothetical protein